jgi:ribosome-binding factor A
MAVKRTDRLNSLLKEVISEVIRREVRNPHVTELVTVTRVQISKDLHYAKVFISVIGSEQQKVETIAALNSAAGFIAVNSSQKVTMRYFPALTFKLDDSVDKHMRIEELLGQVNKERESRPHSSDDEEEESDDHSLDDEEQDDEEEKI